MAGVFLKFLRRCGLPLLAVLCLLTAGCDTVFFYPNNKSYLDPADAQLDYEDVYFENREQQKLHGWLLHTKGPAKGHVLFLHGNAENISSHILSVFWLPERGYDVFLLDYRGYGKSEGSPGISGVIADAEDALRMFAARPEVNGEPIILFGQSLGGAVAVDVATADANRGLLKALVIDSAFSSFRGVARDKIGQFWLTWPFQYPLSWFLSGGYDPLDRIASVSPMPLLVLHGEADQIVPYYHSERLFERAKEPKQFWHTAGVDHIGMLRIPIYRELFVEYMAGLPPG